MSELFNKLAAMRRASERAGRPGRGHLADEILPTRGPISLTDDEDFQFNEFLESQGTADLHFLSAS